MYIPLKWCKFTEYINSCMYIFIYMFISVKVFEVNVSTIQRIRRINKRQLFVYALPLA